MEDNYISPGLMKVKSSRKSVVPDMKQKLQLVNNEEPMFRGMNDLVKKDSIFNVVQTSSMSSESSKKSLKQAPAPEQAPLVPPKLNMKVINNDNNNIPSKSSNLMTPMSKRKNRRSSVVSSN